MQKIKKNWVLRLMGVALMFTLVSTSLLGGTLAKYITTGGGNDTARVAKWGFTGINNVELFKTAYTDTSAGETVKSANTDKIVAPGTKGTFSFTVAGGASEVAARITFAFTETNTGNVPIVYEYDGLYYSEKVSGSAYLKQPGTTSFTPITIAGNLVALAAVLNADASFIIMPGIAPATPPTPLNWFWAFEQDATDATGANIGTRDTADTALGTAGTATVVFNAIINAVQVD